MAKSEKEWKENICGLHLIFTHHSTFLMVAFYYCCNSKQELTNWSNDFKRLQIRPPHEKKSKKKESRSHKAAVAAVDFDDNVETFCAC